MKLKQNRASTMDNFLIRKSKLNESSSTVGSVNQHLPKWPITSTYIKFDVFDTINNDVIVEQFQNMLKCQSSL